MTCHAPVGGSSTKHRASLSDSPRCQRPGRVLLGGKFFCYQHAPAWSVHYAIVEKIRAIPLRDAI